MKKRVLIFIVCYQAEPFIKSVLNRIPDEIWTSEVFDVEVLVIDDESVDQTFYQALDFAHQNQETRITVLYNPRNQGYGGNQKIGYHYAIQHTFDLVVLLHGDGQYPPEHLPQMIQPILDDEADVVLGSRMVKKFNALKGGMPLYKWIGNQILTSIQNRILGSHLAEFHTGYRAFRVSALAAIPFAYNSDYFDFDTDILIQLLDTGNRLHEIAVPTFYGEEVSRVNGFKYAARIVRTSLLSRIMRLSIFYHPRFDYDEDPYAAMVPKFGFPSSHQMALDRVRPGSTVLDVGCGPGYMARKLHQHGARVISIDRLIHPTTRRYSEASYQVDIETYDFATGDSHIDTVLLLDVLEHLRRPEQVLRALRQRYSRHQPEVIITMGNVSFITIRIGLLFGQFNYSKRGILDLDHTRLFTFSTLRQMLQDNGYEVVEEQGIPVPFPLALGHNAGALLLTRLNSLLIRLSKSLFAYQIAIVARPKATMSHLLQDAIESSERKQTPASTATELRRFS